MFKAVPNSLLKAMIASAKTAFSSKPLSKRHQQLLQVKLFKKSNNQKGSQILNPTKHMSTNPDKVSCTEDYET